MRTIKIVDNNNKILLFCQVTNKTTDDIISNEFKRLKTKENFKRKNKIFAEVLNIETLKI